MIFKFAFRSVVLFALLFLPLNLHAITHSVAVMPFENTAKDSSLDWLSMGIPETITNDLFAIKGLVLVERLQLRKVMDEQKLQFTGAIDDKTVVQVGKLIGASVLVVGAFQKQDDIVRLTARFVDVKTGGILQTAKVTGQMKEIFELQDQIVKDLAKNLNIELKQEELAKLNIKPTQSLEAYKHFGQGALLQAKKDYQGAVKELKKATTLDPKFAAANAKFKDAFWSLNKENYWTYETLHETKGKLDKNEPMTSQSKSLSTRRAGGMEDFNGTPAFFYDTEMDMELTQNFNKTDRKSKSRAVTSMYHSKGNDGIYVLGTKMEIKTELYRGKGDPVVMTSTSTSTSTMIFDPPILAFPYDLKVGKKWAMNSTIKAVAMNIPMLSENEVVGKEMLTVPAGIFECFVVENKAISESEVKGVGKLISEILTTSWFAPGVGTIKTRTVAESKSQTYESSLITEMVLKEYHIQQ
ncbi:MAG: CsgG/HfaB family protein [Elusimicrobiota bacterium]|nr:CsgG/HfaB family protein [Elusimicrobiota bacterium]